MFIRQAFYIFPGFYWERRSRQKIEKRQVKKLNAFLENARRTIPYYQNQEIYSKPINSLDDIKDFPIIDKNIVREAGSGLHNEKYCNDKSKAKAYPTSGTTGQPAVFYHDSNCFDYVYAGHIRKGYATKKYHPLLKILHITTLYDENKQLFYQKLGLFRRTCIASFTPISEIKKILFETKPNCLISYPVIIADLVASMSKEELEEASKFIKLIFTESEMLPDHLRKYIQDSLKTEIFDDYASHDVLTITYECSHHRHHILEDRIYFEILDDQGNPVPDGVEGNIVITSYLEKAMPLMRYWQWDKGIRSSEPCPCGRTFKTLKLTSGRTNHCIRLENGAKIYSPDLILLPTYVDGMRQMYVHQDKEGKIIVYYIPYEGADINKINEFIISYFAKKFATHPEIKITDSIPKAKSGKAQLIVSELPEDGIR